MELRTLEYFLIVAREGNISRAANIIHISQPSLSKQLMQLEKEFGKKLLIRGNRSVKLTPEGMLLKNRAEELIDLATKTKIELTNDIDYIGGDVFIGSGETDAFYCVSESITKLGAKYPDLKFNIISGNSDEIKEKIDKGLVDIGLVIQPIDTDRYDYINMPIKEQWGILTNNDNPLSKKEFLTYKDLIDQRLICPQRIVFKNEFYKWIGEENKVNIVATYNLINTAIMMVKKGLGIALCIKKDSYSNNQLSFIPLKPEMISTPAIIWKKNQVFTPSVRKLIDTIRYSISE